MDEASQSIAAGFPLSPLQEGMLYHASTEGVPGVDIEQILCTLSEHCDLEAFRKAWETLIARHPPLRTRFAWEGLDRPLQITAERGELEFRVLDWRDEEAATDLGELLRRDREESFDLSLLPLMRVTVVMEGDESWHCLWTFHHILLDGRSFPILLEEIFDLYEAYADGRNLECEPAHSYREFIEWLENQDFGGSESFWRQRLSGFDAPTPLPLAGLAAGGGNERVEAVESRLPSDETRQLRTAADQLDVTVNTLLQGAWSLVLHHCTGERDVVFGATRACRRTVDHPAADAVGLLINTLPVRADIRADDDLASFLGRLRELHVATRDHEHSPLTDVRRWSDLAPGQPLFESLVVFENYLLDTRMRRLGGRWSSRRFRYLGQTNFPLALIAYDDGEELVLRLEYRTSLYDGPTARSLLQFVTTILREVPQHLGTHPSLIRYGPIEGEAAWGDATQFTVESCIHELFEAKAAESPEAAALTYEDTTLTYAELDARANHLAGHLRSMGVGRDVLVGLLLDRSVEQVVGVLGVLKAGGAYVPIDPSYPVERISLIVEDANVPVLVTHGGHAASLPRCSAEIVRFDELETWPAAARCPESWIPPDPESLAYVIYTSGSTGRPKGVPVTHRNVARLLLATEAQFAFGPEDVWTLFHSYAFDFSVWEMWGALAYGGRLVVVPYVVSRSPESFFDLLLREGVTVLNQTPSAFVQLSRIATRPAEQRRLSLKWVVFGGEALDPASLRPWVERYGFDAPRLVNMYGITETTVHVTYRLLTPDDVLRRSRSVIGEPLPDLTLLVLDPSGRPAPVGVPGELHVGGAGLARGYLNRPALTAQRFIEVRGPSGNRRLYRSGDLARRLPNGDVEYLGRIDDQVKIRGFRIELGETESAMSRIPGVSQATVIVREDDPGHRRLVGYFVPSSAPGPSPRDVREHLVGCLPEHMVPAALVPLDALPLTPHGKVDRKALPVPQLDAVGPRAYSSPRNDAERVLAAVWEEVLGARQVGIDDDFYELGGDSILSMQIASRARSRGLRIGPGDVLLHTTIRDLAGVVVEVETEKNSPGAAEVGPVPLTPIQAWFFDLEVPDVHHWNQAVVMDVASSTKVEALAAAVRVTFAHHDAFRLRFSPTAEGWSQSLVQPGDPPELEEVVEPRTIEDLVSGAERGLNIENGPVVRILLAGPSTGPRLVIVAHHLVVDGVSWRIILEDLDAAYRAITDRREVSLPRVGSSYGAWSRALARYASAGLPTLERAYWASVRTDPEALPGRKAGSNLESSGRTLVTRLPSGPTQKLLGDVHHAYKTRINEVLVAAFARALGSWTGRDSVGFDLEGHGREDVGERLDLSRTVGWFTSIFPVHLALPVGRLPGEDLLAVKEHLRGVPSNGIGYGILSLHDPSFRGGRCQPGNSVAFNYLGRTDRLVSKATLFATSGTSILASHAPSASRPYEIEVIAEVVDGELRTRWMYSDDLHEERSVRMLADAFQTRLGELIDHCSDSAVRRATPGDFPNASLTQAEVDGLLARFPEIDDVTSLPPMQELYYGVSLADPRLGYEQWHFRVRGPLDLARLRRSWNLVVSRHEIMRSAFVSDGLSRLHRVALREAELQWHEVALDGMAGADSEVERILEGDEAGVLDLAAAPLARVTTVRRSAEDHDLIWGTHHLVVDGWSWPLVVGEVSAAYRDFDSLREAAVPPGYGSYVSWLRKRDTDDERRFWSQLLAGFPQPTSLGPSRSPGAVAGPDQEVTREMKPEETAELIDASRGLRVTPGTLVQSAWALLLSVWSGDDDVVFGAAFSGRPGEVDRVGEIVGPFVNNLPVRYRTDERATVRAWLSAAQDRQIQAATFQHTSLGEVHQWSEMPTRQRMFESLVVVQNYVVDSEVFELGPTTRLELVGAPQATNYALTVIATPAESLRLSLAAKGGRWSSDVLDRLGGVLERTLLHLVRNPDLALLDVKQSLDLDFMRAPVVPTRPEPARGSDREATELEATISDVIREAIGMEEVGLYENFFDLGAHSVLLVAVHAALEEAFGRSFPVTDVFEYATIAGLAEHLGGAGAESGGAGAAARERARMMRQRLRRRTGRGRTRGE